MSRAKTRGESPHRFSRPADIDNEEKNRTLTKRETTAIWVRETAPGDEGRSFEVALLIAVAVW